MTDTPTAYGCRMTIPPEVIQKGGKKVITYTCECGRRIRITIEEEEE